ECRSLVGRTVTVGGAPWQIVGLLPPAEDTPSECSGKPSPTFRAGNPLGRLVGVAPVTAALSAMVEMPGRPLVPALVLVASRVEDLRVARGGRALARRTLRQADRHRYRGHRRLEGPRRPDELRARERAC